jgi:hypothetical protein
MPGAVERAGCDQHHPLQSFRVTTPSRHIVTPVPH